jgi:predicted ArsR family transcriptional regulator
MGYVCLKKKMEFTKIGSRFFSSTRGQIVRLLRGATRTVEELAASLNLTDNAVRAHLATLERDGLVSQTGVRHGSRKPHFTYALAPAAEQLFPKSYDELFNVLLIVLKEKLTSRQLKGVLREVGRKVAQDKVKSAVGRSDLSEKTREAANVLEALGGAPRVESEDGKFMIRSENCPLAGAVESHSEVCSVAAALIGQITGGLVSEKCNNTEAPPRCLFEIVEKRHHHN